jgi:hypothetical protein
VIDLVKQHSQAMDASSVRTRAVDTGMAATLLCLLAGFFTGKLGWFYSAATVLVVNMTWPRAFVPASTIWFGFSALLGSVMSRVILSLVYYLVLTPVGLLRRAMRRDTLKIAAFKAGTESVFTTRAGRFVPKDLATPF